ncbi:MAG: hypothetical protein HYZ86_03095 [Candidatus Omnitrophica bacterium]|nr:hypothetical protein [Candidatus Omnitrophota bacterium]
MKPFYISLKPFLDHQVLPRPAHWATIFGNDRPVEVEIGFGNGEYLARLSTQNPQVNYVGFEEYCERIQRTLRKVNHAGVVNARVLRLDVRPGFDLLFAPKTVRFIHCLFPPPWPKKSGAKHRLFDTAFLRLANNRLRDGGTLKIVTDHRPYAGWITDNVPGTGFDLRLEKVPARYDTKFERKWAEGGQKEFYELTLAKKEHVNVARRKDAAMQHYVMERFDPDRFSMPDHSADGIAVVCKDFLYDPKRKTAMVHVLVNEEHLLQNIRIVIVNGKKGWTINLAQGSLLMPTAGVAKALECVHQAALASVGAIIDRPRGEN